MSKTDKNLMDAFAGESQANRKYLAFAKQVTRKGCLRLPNCSAPPPKPKPSTLTPTCATRARSATLPPTSRRPSKAKPTNSPRCIPK